MTLETWKAEFYTIPADHPDALAAPAAHSLRKWEGRRAENLERHGLVVRSLQYAIREPETDKVFIFGPDECSLCRACKQECTRCPVVALSGLSCAGDKESEYQQFFDTGDPEPMIALLRRCAELEAKEKEGEA
jgi:hypothetical protein